MDTQKYEVVRQDYFFSLEEPQFTFKNGKAYINAFGLRLYPDKDYIQILINKEEKTLIVKPFQEKVKDSFRWSAGKKRQPRHMRCVPLFYMVYQMMGWNINARYRTTGFQQQRGKESVLYFDLKEAICYMDDKEYFPKEWETNFGIIETMHKESELVTVFEEDALFEIKLPVNEANLSQMMEGRETNAGADNLNQ